MNFWGVHNNTIFVQSHSATLQWGDAHAHSYFSRQIHTHFLLLRILHHFETNKYRCYKLCIGDRIAITVYIVLQNMKKSLQLRRKAF